MTRRNRTLALPSCVAPARPWSRSPWRKVKEILRTGGKPVAEERLDDQGELFESERSWHETEEEWRR